LENIWFFRKELYKFRSWDYSFNLDLFRRSLEKTVNTIEHYGNEVDESRLKKVEKMKRAIYLLNRIKEDNYIKDAQTELGEIKNSDWFNREDTPEEKKHNREVFNRAHELENEEWKELWSIFQGQDTNEFKKIYDSKTDDEKRDEGIWNNWFDGSGLKGWWD
jgi:hypothetical protein